MDADAILSAPFPDFEMIDWLAPSMYGTFDKEGSPVYVKRYGAPDYGIMTRTLTEDLLVMAHMRHMEHCQQLCRQQTERLGRPVTSSVGIFDMKGFRMPGRNVLALFKVCSSWDTNHYPETQKKLLVINAPWIFTAFWRIAQRFVDPVTKAKVRLVGSNFQDVLHAEIPADQLPPEYGGTSVERFNPGTKLPEAEVRERLGFITFSLAAGAADVLHTVECSGGGTGAFWHWYTDGYDVNFSATFTPAGKGSGEAQVLVAPGLATTNKGIIAPAGPGSLTLSFNNTHSRFRRKEVYLRLRGDLSPYEVSVRRKVPYSSAPPLEVTEEELAETAASGGEGTPEHVGDEAGGPK